MFISHRENGKSLHFFTRLYNFASKYLSFFLPMNLQIKHLISGESPCTLVLLLSPCHYNPYLRILCEQEDKYIMRVWVVG